MKSRTRPPSTFSMRLDSLPLCCLLTLIPILCAVTLSMLWGFDAPYMDQWSLVPLMAKCFDGTWTFADLWAQHNIHRIPIPKAVMLLLARLTGWNNRYELAVSMTFAVATLGVLLAQIRRSRRFCGIESGRFVFPLAAFLFFSLAQWENLLWGWHLLIFFNTFGVVAGTVALSDKECTWQFMALAAFSGVLATYSYANGLLFWPIGFLVVLFVAPENRRLWLKRVAAWSVISLLVVAAYLHGFARPERDPSFALIFSRPWASAYYLLAYLGNGLVNYSVPAAACVGFAGVILLLVLLWRNMKTRQTPHAVLAPYLALILYGVGSAMITMVARVGFGVLQALSSRYLIFSSLFWIGLVAILHIETEPRDSGATNVSRARRSTRILLTLILLLVLANSSVGFYRIDERHDAFVPARNALITGDNPAFLRRLLPEPERVLDLRKILQKQRLSAFRGSSPALPE